MGYISSIECPQYGALVRGVGVMVLLNLVIFLHCEGFATEWNGGIGSSTEYLPFYEPQFRCLGFGGFLLVRFIDTQHADVSTRWWWNALLIYIAALVHGVVRYCLQPLRPPCHSL